MYSTPGTLRINVATSNPRPPQPIKPSRTRSFAPKISFAEAALAARVAVLSRDCLVNSRRFISTPDRVGRRAKHSAEEPLSSRAAFYTLRLLLARQLGARA